MRSECALFGRGWRVEWRVVAGSLEIATTDGDVEGCGERGMRRSGASRTRAVEGVRRGVRVERRMDAVVGAEERGITFRGREEGERPLDK